jgi:hypothetical protein
MLTLAFFLLTVSPESFEVLERHATQLKSAVPILKGCYSKTWRITGKQVKAVLGQPQQIQILSFQSGGIWHYCWCNYEKLGICVTLYAENQLVWAVPGTKEIPEHWELLSIRPLRTTRSK